MDARNQREKSIAAIAVQEFRHATSILTDPSHAQEAAARYYTSAHEWFDRGHYKVAILLFELAATEYASLNEPMEHTAKEWLDRSRSIYNRTQKEKKERAEGLFPYARM